MSFAQDYITSVAPPIKKMGQLYLSWTSTAPTGTWYQVYVDGQLVARTRATSAVIPAPTGRVQIQIGTVASSDSQTNLSSSFVAAAPQNRATLSWQGGTFEQTLGAIAGFYVYSATELAGFGIGGFGSGGFGSPAGFGSGGFGGGGYGSGGVDYDLSPLATIPAYTAGMISDGFGLGGFGGGGFGHAPASYTWTSDPLPGGTWVFAVAPYDTAGNIGQIQTAAVTIVAPPAPPAPFANGDKLEYTVDGLGAAPYGDGGYGQSIIQLFWNPSPSAA